MKLLKWEFFIFFTAWFIAPGMIAQSGTSKTDDASVAKILKEKFKNEKETGVVSISSVEEYSFERSASSSLSNPVTAAEFTTHDLIAIKDNYTYSGALFYDDQSEIAGVHAKKAKGGPVVVYTSHKSFEQDGIFLNDTKLCYFNLDFYKPGDRLNFNYEKRYLDVKYLTMAFFHEQFPVEEKKLVFIVPDWLRVEFKEMNFEGYSIVKNVMPDPKKKTTIYSYTVKGLRAMKEEKNAPPASHAYPHVVVLCKTYKDKLGNERKLFDSVDDLYAWFSYLTKQVKADAAVLKPTVEKLVASGKTDQDKIEAIFYWVQDNIRYIAFEQGIMGYRPEAADKVFANKYGDCKGMANLTKEMLKIAGYDARLTWIGTRDIPYDFTLPALCVANHMICTVFLNGKRYFLDGTEKFIALNDYAHRIQGRPVLIEDGEKYILDKVPEFDASRNNLVTNIEMTLVKDVLKGKLRQVFNGEEKIGLLSGLYGVRTEDRNEIWKRFLAAGDPGIVIGEIKTSEFNERLKPLDVTYDFELQNRVTTISENEIYVTIDKDKEFGTLLMDSTRMNDYDFIHKVSIETRTEFTVPNGYKIVYLPEPVDKKHAEFSFFLKYELVGNKVVYTKKITIDNAVVRKADFKTWNGFVKAAKNFYNDPIQISNAK